MKISEASRVSGVSARSLRHYEHEGLIVPGRFSNGFRDYCQSTIDRVLVIRSLLESGLPVRLIKEVCPASPTDLMVARTWCTRSSCTRCRAIAIGSLRVSPFSAISRRRSTPTCGRLGALAHDRHLTLTQV